MATSYDVGDEIWQESLADAIYAEAEMIAGYAGSDLLESPDSAHRDALRDRIVNEMTAALVSVGDGYRAPDGVLYSLIEQSGADPLSGEGRLSELSVRTSEPIIEEALRFENVPLGSAGTRRAVVRWSDGTGEDPLRAAGGRRGLLSAGGGLRFSSVGWDRRRTARVVSRTTLEVQGCTKAVRRERPNGAGEPRRLAAREREDRL